ncbi:mitochondrial import inner membrane translocase subunit tim54, partial [Kappamyces sp. JEL0680]
KKGEKNCYKSVYFNLDSTAFTMVALFFLWAGVTSRAVEGMVLALLEGNLRVSIATALVASIPSVWYVCSVMIHYMNDRYYPYYYSQLFFTISELSCQLIAIAHIRKDARIYRTALIYLGGSALSHIAQLLMDEPLLITSNGGTTFRNLALVAGDAANLYAAWTLSGKWRRKLWSFVGVCIVYTIYVKTLTRMQFYTQTPAYQKTLRSQPRAEFLTVSEPRSPARSFPFLTLPRAMEQDKDVSSGFLRIRQPASDRERFLTITGAESDCDTREPSRRLEMATQTEHELDRAKIAAIIAEYKENAMKAARCHVASNTVEQNDPAPSEPASESSASLAVPQEIQTSVQVQMEPREPAPGPFRDPAQERAVPRETSQTVLEKANWTNRAQELRLKAIRSISITAKAKSYIPSRNWSIFFISVGGTVGLFVYDKRQVKSIQRELAEKAAAIASQPTDWNTPNRKVKVFVEPTSWSPYWFEEMAKPIFDAGAVDYQVIERDHPAGIIEDVRNLIWDAREQHHDEATRKTEQRPSSWFSFGSNPQTPKTQQELEKLQQEMQNQLLKEFMPHVYKPKYDPAQDIIAVGPIPWRHVLLGLEEGSLTDRQEERGTRQTRDVRHMLPPSVPYPTLGYLSGPNISGWANVPLRVAGWFNKRAMARVIGAEALEIVLNRPVAFSPSDVKLGSSDFRPYPKKKESDKEKTVADSIAEAWTEEAEALPGVHDVVADRLSRHAFPSVQQ